MMISILKVQFARKKVLTLTNILWNIIQRQKMASFIGNVFQLTYAALVDKLIQQEKLNHCDGCAIQHPSQNQHSCLMMDNDDAWMYYHDEVVEQIDLNSMLNATESICSALGFKLGKSWEAYVTELQKNCRGPVFTSLLWNLMLSSKVMILKAVFYTLYTTDQMGSNGRISMINKKQ